MGFKVNAPQDNVRRPRTKGFKGNKRIYYNFCAAKEIVEHILKSVEVLKENPSLGKPGRVLRTRELIITKYPYIVPYRIKDDDIYILRVLHTSRKWS